LRRRAAQSPGKVLITGESGVGKDVVARFIHSQSMRRHAPFVAVNCAGLTETRVRAVRPRQGQLHWCLS
jgi:two-component system response regulator FlrC